MDLILETERLVLRPVVAGDAEDLWPSVSDPDLPYHMSWETHRDLEQTRAFLTFCESVRASGIAATWAARDRSGTFVALVGLHDILRQVRAWRRDVAELGYWAAPPFQGRGYVTEAGRAVVDAAFTRLGLHKVTVGCIAENAGSKRVIEKLGFRFVGTQRDHAFRHGRWWDHLSYEITEGEWRELRRA